MEVPEGLVCTTPGCVAEGSAFNFVQHTRSRTPARFKCSECGRTFSVPPTQLSFRKQHPTDVVLGVGYLVLTERYPVATVARNAGISRPTAYRWMKELQHRKRDLQIFEQQLIRAVGAMLELNKAQQVPSRFVRDFTEAARTKPWLNIRWYEKHRSKLEPLGSAATP